MTLLLPHRGLSPLNTLCIATVCVYFPSAPSLLPVLLNVWSPPLGELKNKNLSTSLSQWLKRRLLDSTHRQSCRATDSLHKSAHSITFYHSISLPSIVNFPLFLCAFFICSQEMQHWWFTAKKGPGGCNLFPFLTVSLLFVSLHSSLFLSIPHLLLLPVCPLTLALSQ